MNIDFLLLERGKEESQVRPGSVVEEEGPENVSGGVIKSTERRGGRNQ